MESRPVDGDGGGGVCKKVLLLPGFIATKWCDFG